MYFYTCTAGFDLYSENFNLMKFFFRYDKYFEDVTVRIMYLCLYGASIFTRCYELYEMYEMYEVNEVFEVNEVYVCLTNLLAGNHQLVEWMIKL